LEKAQVFGKAQVFLESASYREKPEFFETA
jgi:hypothetical protein